ncbi:MAG: LTA synthase family protein, partial [Cyclobacteriaceae bacterium]|nr:LTA synthase family protein [Cyclobacteriaceae bacterium]
LIDIAYFPFIHKRMQADALLFVSGEKGTDFFYLIPTFLGQFWYLWLLFIIFIGAIWKIYDYSNSFKVFVPRSLKLHLGSLALFIGVAALAFLGVRGGLQLKPLQLIHASNMTEVQNIPALINTPFSLYSTVTKEKLPEVQYFTKEELNETDQGIHTPTDSVKMNNQNVVLIIVESFSKKYLGYFNDQAQTPFLDSLTNEGLIFTNGFANATESIQGIPAVISSIPSLMDESFIFSPYSTNKITSIPSLLKEKGYSTSFFHGGNNGTMGFDLFSKLAGFDTYYGRNEYGNDEDFDGKWGIWDEPFLQYMADQLDATPQPFFTSVLTLNTHHPFKIPEKYNDKFKQEGHPIYSCFQYTDYALKLFFQEAKKSEWFGNTLFIITADHAAPNFEKVEISPLENYQIPILFYKPDGSLKGVNEKTANQIDILPSLLHLLAYPEPFFSFGNDLFKEGANTFSVNYKSGIYQLIDSEFTYQFNGQEGVGLYNWKEDPFLHNSLDFDKPSVKQMEHQLKKTIQLFNHSLVNNKMVFDHIYTYQKPPI